MDELKVIDRVPSDPFFHKSATAPSIWYDFNVVFKDSPRQKLDEMGISLVRWIAGDG